MVWDSVFFSRIALCGYEYEQFYAFFPFLPGNIWCLVAEAILVSTRHLLCRNRESPKVRAICRSAQYGRTSRCRKFVVPQKNTQWHCTNMPCSVVQAFDATIGANAALELASASLSTTAFVISAVYLHK